MASTIALYNVCRQSAADGGRSRDFPSRAAAPELDEGSPQQFGRRRVAGVRYSGGL